jgi:2-polyprenyl-3-methyl-5-hydroxy-6-metoxy-1,4-benzoquinol methylase
MSTTTDTAAADEAGWRDALAGWFAAVPEVKARLEASGARVLDVGCGIGWSSISLAKAFPSLRVDGIDSDEASITVFWRYYRLTG